MKNSFCIAIVLIIAGFLLVQSSPVWENIPERGSIFTAEVKKVVDNKCYGCHSAGGKSQNAKDALIWDSLPNLPKSRLVATLDDIIRVLQKNVMPPESAVKKYPEMKLQPGERKILQSWAESKADSLLR